MKTLLLILSFYSDSVKAKVKHSTNYMIVYKIEGQRFISYCNRGLKRGDVFYIDRKIFDSLLRESKPIRKRKI